MLWEDDRHDENDDRLREEPETYMPRTKDTIINALREENADLKAEIIVLQNLVRDMDYCRFMDCTNCEYQRGGSISECGADISYRVEESKEFWEAHKWKTDRRQR